MPTVQKLIICGSLMERVRSIGFSDGQASRFSIVSIHIRYTPVSIKCAICCGFVVPRVEEQIHNKSHSLSLHSILYRRHLSPLIPHKNCLVIKPNKSAVSPVRSGSLPAGCHGNLPVLNLLSASVTKNQHFRPCRKNYALDRKMLDSF